MSDSHNDAVPLKPVPPPDRLTLRELVGQVMCCGWAGEDATAANAHARELIEDLGVGALVVMSRNIGGVQPLRNTLEELQTMARIPLLVAIDHEGGRVTRTAEALHRFPGNMALGAIRDRRRGRELAQKQGRVQAVELRALGINWNFAPCVDVNCNPLNPVIGVRSFGEDPGSVAALGSAVIRGLQGQGVLACAKHFPGHGDTSVDSHLGLPTSHGDRERLNRVELRPFRTAIRSGVGSIMTAHIVFPAMDPDRPATLSPRVLTDLLRKGLGFRRLIITDCLEMAAVAETVGTPTAAVEALVAGADMVLICHTLQVQRQAFEAIFDAVRTGRIPEARLREAASRVLRAKRRWAEPPLPLSALGSPEADALETAIARESVTVLWDRGVLPLSGETSVVVLSDGPDGEAFAENLRAMGLTEVAACPYGMDSTASVEPGVTDGNPTVVALLGRAPSDRTREGLLHTRALELTKQRADRVILVLVDAPYRGAQYGDAGACLCTYSQAPCSLRAAAEALMGAYRPHGKLPVTVPGLPATR